MLIVSDICPILYTKRILHKVECIYAYTLANALREERKVREGGKEH